jgi:hypothetical protein
MHPIQKALRAQARTKQRLGGLREPEDALVLITTTLVNAKAENTKEKQVTY